MIHYAPGYVGLAEIRQLVGSITGNEGLGNGLLPIDLQVLGKNFGAPIVLRIGPNSALLAAFLEVKLGMEVVSGAEEEDIAFNHWITLDKEIRDTRKNACAKAIIMAYLACNDFIQWAPQVPQVPQPIVWPPFSPTLQFHP